MKKIAALMLALVLAIAAIGCSAPADQNQDNTPANDNKEPYRVAMVTDTGGINDQSFNASAWAGLQRAQEELGCEVAYNLDGGGSSALYFNGTVVNNPTTNGRRIQERSVSDIVYIGY